MKFKSHLYYEDRDEVQEALRNLKPLLGAKIDFFKNGVHQGRIFMQEVITDLFLYHNLFFEEILNE